MSLQRYRVKKLDPDVADDVPWSEDITPYDEEHLVTYLRLLDADSGRGHHGRRSRASSCIGILSWTLNGRVAAGRFTWPVRAG